MGPAAPGRDESYLVSVTNEQIQSEEPDKQGWLAPLHLPFLTNHMSLAVIRVLRQTRFNPIAAQSFRQFSATMQAMTADDRANILSDIKRDHAQFFSLHRRFKDEVGLSDHDKQTIIWQVRSPPQLESEQWFCWLQRTAAIGRMLRVPDLQCYSTQQLGCSIQAGTTCGGCRVSCLQSSLLAPHKLAP